MRDGLTLPWLILSFDDRYALSFLVRFIQLFSQQTSSASPRWIFFRFSSADFICPFQYSFHDRQWDVVPYLPRPCPPIS